MDPRISLRPHGAGLLVVVVDTVQPFLVAQGIVQVHGASPGHHERLADSCLHQSGCYIIGNLDFHPAVSLPVLNPIAAKMYIYREYSIK